MKEEKMAKVKRLLDALADIFVKEYLDGIRSVNLDRLSIQGDYDWKQNEYDDFLERFTYEEQRYILEKVQEKLKENENEK